MDIDRVQRFLGHKTGEMTQRYTHHSPESLRDGVRVLEEPRPEKVSTRGRSGGFAGGEKSRNLLI
ncbi:MAG: hypothetical protein EPO64_07180 [Nitrospirae bacterium]|nr:MAG: hypothetical protein EPO64_07180 [Nitrospirota bacterium]